MRFMTTGISLAARTASGEYGEREVTGASIKLNGLRGAHFQPEKILLQTKVFREAIQRLLQADLRFGEITIAPGCETMLESELRPRRRTDFKSSQHVTALVQEKVRLVGVETRSGQSLPTTQNERAVRLLELGQMFPDGNTPNTVLDLLGVEQRLESDQVRVLRLLEAAPKGTPADGQQS